MKTKVISVGILVAAMAACAARPRIDATPAQQAQAVAIVMSGGTARDVGTVLHISDADARRLVRATARELMTWLHASYDGPAGERVVLGPVVVPAPPTGQDGGTCEAQAGDRGTPFGMR